LTYIKDLNSIQILTYIQDIFALISELNSKSDVMLRLPRYRVIKTICVYTDSYRVPCCLVHNTNTQFDKIIIK